MQVTSAHPAAVVSIDTVTAQPAADEDVMPAKPINAALAALVADCQVPGNLRSAVEHSLLSGGKRLRPLLAIGACEAVCGDAARATAAACALECVHAFSLTHDDLPALDNDDLRRGRPTTHVAFGEAMAILAGDALLSMAFQALTIDANRTSDNALAGRLSRELATATTSMIEGQVYDTLGGLDPSMGDKDKIEQIHRKKTGALITAACKMGAMAGGAPDDSESLKRLTRFGQAVGLMFQIVDDLIDVEQTAEHVGKRTGKDIDAGKMTYPAILGVEQSRVAVDQLRSDALQAIRPLGANADRLVTLCEKMARRTR